MRKSSVVFILAFLVVAYMLVLPVLWQRQAQLEAKVAALESQLAPPASTQKNISLQKGDHILGDAATAKVVLIEYSDTECPFCKRFHSSLHEVKNEYGAQVAWVYRYFPLSIHQNAQKEAEALQCVSQQGGENAFWNYLDQIFSQTTSNGTGFSLDQLGPLAKAQGLNQADFMSCWNGGKGAARVLSDTKTGTGLGINGTPTTFLVKKDGSAQRIDGAISLEELKADIDKAIQ